MTEFPAQWGSWFAGFTENYGRFSIDKENGDNPRDNYRCKFELSCHPADRQTLKEIRHKLGLGDIIDEPVSIEEAQKGQFRPRLEVTLISECTEIVQVFESYPLRTRKRGTFDIWKQAVKEQSKPLDDRDPLMLDYYFTMLPRAERSEYETNEAEGAAKDHRTAQEGKPSSVSPAERQAKPSGAPVVGFHPTSTEPAPEPQPKKTSFRLYEITDAILNQYTDQDDDEPNIEELEKWDAAFDHKIESCAAVVKNLTAQADACKEEASLLSQKARVTNNKIDTLKEYMKRNMEFVDKKNVTAGIFKVRIQKSPMSIKVQDADKIPEQFKWEFKEWRIDKKAIADSIKETGEIPDGVKVPDNTHLRIT